MNLLSLVGPRLDNICQIRRKWYYSSGLKYLQSKRGLNLLWIRENSLWVCGGNISYTCEVAKGKCALFKDGNTLV
jgi:hypothetical protein